MKRRIFNLINVSHKMILLALSVMLLAAVGGALSGCGAEEPQTAGAALRPYTLENSEAPADAVFPPYVKPEVKDAYEFALARPDVLKYLPCYCGCGRSGAHANTLDCFIEGVEADGSIRFESHGSFCDICLDTARDARRLLGEGKKLSDIRAYIDQTYSKMGVGTDTPLPPE